MSVMLNQVLKVPKRNGGHTVTAKKDRTRLTVYLDTPLYERFVEESDAQYRSLSDHMNAILAEYYSKQDKARAATVNKNGNGSK